MKHKGQAALILILITAMALIFFAITLNWGRLAQIKTMTMSAATTTVASMVSSYASYGEQKLQTELGGKPKICKTSSILETIILAIVIIIIAVVSCIYAGCSGIPLVLMIITIALAVATVVLQVTVVQPGMSRVWNKMQQNLPISAQFAEQGLQSGIQGVVSDPVQITDYFDLNSNGHFGFTAARPEDTISRFGFFYTEHMKALQGMLPASGNPNLQAFLDGLKGLVNGGTPAYPLRLNNVCADTADTRCNSCCLPLEDSDGNRIRPQGCSDDTVPPGCAPSAWPYAATYPFAYDPVFPAYVNGPYPGSLNDGGSFLTNFGVDAEVRAFKKQDAKGLFSFLWDMDIARADPNVQPSPNTVPPTAALDSRFSDQVGQISNFQANDADCAQGLDPVQGFWWKKGMDQYCSTTWPYDECAKSAPCSEGETGCGCTAATATQWPEDGVDDVLYGLKRFYAWSNKILSQDADSLQETIEEWYPQAEQWVGAEGLLYKYRDRLAAWKPMLDTWLGANYADANAWCVPPSSSSVPAAESAYINSQSPAWGSLDSAIACLEYESFDSISGNLNSANDTKFLACRSAIEALSCTPATCGSCAGIPQCAGCALSLANCANPPPSPVTCSLGSCSTFQTYAQYDRCCFNACNQAGNENTLINCLNSLICAPIS
ncbi:MAG: hypothetical protein HY591_01520, partial [Candidatus Omnitrophica bacterium]|nr:hypothetical protein [Candidatus Omnitrophota bacterium]